MLHHVPGRRSQRASLVLSALTCGFSGRFIADGDSSESSFPYAFPQQLVYSLPRRRASACSRGDSRSGRQRHPVAVFPSLWYFAALFFRGDGALSPPFPCLSAERRNSGVK